MSVGYHLIRLTSPRSFAIGPVVRALSLVFALIPALSACTYMCHNYRVLPTKEGDLLASPVGRIGVWEVYVDLDRWRNPSKWEPALYNWPHWAASEDDVYRLEVSPVADDSTAWEGVDIEIEKANVTFGDSVLTVGWEEVEDARVDTLHYPESYREHRRTLAPLRFVSEAFFLPTPVPDSLHITIEIRVLESTTGLELNRKWFETEAVIERHRRWGIVDAIES